MYPWSIVASLLTLLTLSHAAHLTLSLPLSPSHPTYHPSSLPSTTHATLYANSITFTALLTTRNTLSFPSIPTGSYLLTIQSRDWTFAPLRIDVAHDPVSSIESIQAWQTFWGNEWGNKGETRGSIESQDAELEVEVRPEYGREYYAARAGFSPVSFLKNPMILMAVVSLGMIFGMPYLMDGMDDETKAEFEEMQSKSPTAKVVNTQSAIQNFDLAGWMASKTTKSSTPAT